MRHSEFIFWREKSPSAIVLMLKECVLEARAAESARLDRARKEAKTTWDGLLDGHKFDKIAGKEDVDCRGARNGGPP